jgi:hypothetical protein
MNRRRFFMLLTGALAVPNALLNMCQLEIPVSFTSIFMYGEEIAKAIELSR